MQKQADYIQQNKAALFDWLVFGISFSMGFIFPTFSNFAYSKGFPFWMLSATLLYTAGAWLKHRPICYRLMRSGKSVSPVPLLLFLLIGHWMIFLTVIILSSPAIRIIIGLPPVTKESPVSGLFTFLSVVIALIITWLVFRTKKKIKKPVSYSPGYLYRRELVADVFLLTAVSILSFAFWEKGVIALLTRKPASTIGDVWFLFVFLSICYVLFYLPLRYLFLIEDHFSRQTWRRLLLIFGLLLLRSLLELLKI